MKNSYKIAGVVAVVVLIGLILAFGHSTPAPVSTATPAPKNIGGNVKTAGDESPNGVILGGVFENYASGKFLPRQNIQSLKNTSGGTLYFDNIEMTAKGTASTTYQFFAFSTSTTITTQYDFTATPLNNNYTNGTTIPINGIIIATSTPSNLATTTSSMDNPGLPRVVAVPDGYTLYFLLKQRYSTLCDGVQCEQATSTNRGIDVYWKAHFHN